MHLRCLALAPTCARLAFLLMGLFCGLGPLHADHPKKGPEEPLLFSEKGRHYFPVSTKKAEAQAFFNQGVTLYYGFNHLEAARSFRRVAELDVDCAMAWWGIGIALGPNYNRDIDPVDAERNKEAFEAAQKALMLSKGATPREKALIEALTRRYALDAKADKRRLEEDYRWAMKKVSQTYPDDLDAAVLYAEAIMNLMPWQLWGPDGKPAKDTDEVLAVLEKVLRRDPFHIGACHYQIHALEASPFPERALNSADRLLKQVPWQGHLTHMPGHIYIHTGDFDLAALSNELAIRADEELFKRRPGKGVYSMMYYPHNIHFLAYARACGGDYKRAAEAAGKLTAYVEPEIEHMPMLEGFAVYPLMIDLRFHRWDKVLEAAEPGEKRVASRVFRHFGRAVALAAQGKGEEAANEKEAFAKLAEKIPADTPMGTNPAGKILAVAAKTLEARLGKDPAAAAARWREVVKLEDELNYGEPPDWIFRGRENLGAALLRAGKVEEAESVFREDLAKLRRSGRALFGLMHCLRAQKREEEADLVRREFERAWPRETPLRLEDF